MKQETFHKICTAIIFVVSIILSTAFSGLSELMRRTLRIQRRLKVFHEHYNETHPIKHIWKRGRKQ